MGTVLSVVNIEWLKKKGVMGTEELNEKCFLTLKNSPRKHFFLFWHYLLQSRLVNFNFKILQSPV